MIQAERGTHIVEMRDEPTYTFGSADNVRAYDREVDLSSVSMVTSKHGVICRAGEAGVMSAVFGASGGATGVHERSLVLLDDRCFVAIGAELVCLDLPSLVLRWQQSVDWATCFGVYLAPDERSLVVHGELEISRWTLDGRVVWSRGGRDIFSEGFAVHAAVVEAVDFQHYKYVFDLETGAELS